MHTSTLGILTVVFLKTFPFQFLKTNLKRPTGGECKGVTGTGVWPAIEGAAV